MAGPSDRSPAEIVGSNPTGGMDSCLLSVLCVVRQRSLRRADHSSRGDLPNVVCSSRKLVTEEALASPTGGCCTRRKERRLNEEALASPTGGCCTRRKERRLNFVVTTNFFLCLCGRCCYNSKKAKST
jgi:hypothetical protein